MSFKKILISGTGCALADFLYNDISFTGPSFKKYLSKKKGDGGLSPGKLVFTEELEKFSGRPYAEILNEITGKRSPNAFNVGGPSLVSLVHTSQMLDGKEFEVRFFGLAGNDEISKRIFDIVQTTPLNIDNYLVNSSNITPFTDVFSDPSYANKHGERTFVNNIGAAWEYSPDFLFKNFFDSDIVCFGGTALVPKVHDNLTLLLKKAKEKECITLVNTVFDFRNEKNHPDSTWPLVESIRNFGLIDILIMDCEEASKISGQKSIEGAAAFFASTDVSSFIITNGPNDLYAMSRGGLFEKTEMIRLPVSEKVMHDLKSFDVHKGDTTGCGDNFTGGIITSIAKQLKSKLKGRFDLIEAISWGVASGGFTCFVVGGTFLEKKHGEKLNRVTILQKEYLKQIGK
jgi:sugar/nucleoside kinase (ribokinase family)